MKSILLLVFISAALGLGLGSAIALVEVGSEAPLPGAEQATSDPALVPEDSNQPKAEVLETNFEFGSIERGATMSHVFEVRNVGDAPLKIEVGEPSCKCTVGSVSTDLIEPGESAQIELEWHAKTPAGAFRHGAPLLTNDPNQSRIDLTVVGQVVESSMLVPSELLFGSIEAGQKREASLYLMAFVDPPVAITSHEVTSKEFAKLVQVRIEPAKPDELPLEEATSGVKITASYQSGKTIGPIRGWLKLETNLPQASVLNIPLYGNVVGEISVFGEGGWNSRSSLLRMGHVSSKDGKKAKLKIAVRGDHAMATKFTVASVDPPELKVSLGERIELGDNLVHVPLLVELPKGMRPMVRAGEPASEDAHIVIHTTHPLSPELKMRVQFTVY